MTDAPVRADGTTTSFPGGDEPPRARATRHTVAKRPGDRGPFAAERLQAWNALLRANADYDPLVVNAAEDRVIAAYSDLMLVLALRLIRTDAPPPVTERAGRVGLSNAVRDWSRPGDTRGFEKYARDAIEAEIRHAHEGYVSAAQGPAAAREPEVTAADTDVAVDDDTDPDTRRDRANVSPPRPIRRHQSPAPAQLSVTGGDRECRITVRGPLDTSGAERLATVFRKVVAPGMHVLVDLSEVKFFGAAGLSALLGGHRRLAGLDGELVVTGVNRRMRQLLQITGDDRVLHIEPVDGP